MTGGPAVQAVPGSSPDHVRGRFVMDASAAFMS